MYQNMRSNPQFNLTHGHNNSHRIKLDPTFQRLTTTQKSLNYCAPKNWNYIPDFIKNRPNVKSFEASYKKYLISKYSDQILAGLFLSVDKFEMRIFVYISRYVFFCVCFVNIIKISFVPILWLYAITATYRVFCTQKPSGVQLCAWFFKSN